MEIARFLRHSRFLCAVVLLSVLSACQSESLDGAWEKMKWKKTTYQQVVNEGSSMSYYLVPVEGGKFVFHCKNYSSIWMADHRFEQNGQVWHSYDRFDSQESQRDYHHYTDEWCDVTAQGDSLKVIFVPNHSFVRKVQIGVTAGDIFDTFSFVQASPLYTE